MSDTPPFALFVRGASDVIFAVSDTLGFESPMEALAVSVFEDGPTTMHVQALYNCEADAEAALTALSLPPNIESFITQLADQDWVSLSQSGLPPVKAGRFWVYGDHDVDNIPEGVAHPICINAGMAFGTGHHGTTKGCLLIYNDLLDQGFAAKDILDLGCGAGTLAIAAAKAQSQTILATDIDPDAVGVTDDNAKLNGVDNWVEAVTADGFNHDALKGRSFDLIFANILAGPLMGLAPDIAKALVPSGYVILSGILNEQADQVIATFAKAGITAKAHTPEGEWTSLLGQRA